MRRQLLVSFVLGGSMVGVSLPGSAEMYLEEVPVPQCVGVSTLGMEFTSVVIAYADLLKIASCEQGCEHTLIVDLRPRFGSYSVRTYEEMPIAPSDTIFTVNNRFLSIAAIPTETVEKHCPL